MANNDRILVDLNVGTKQAQADVKDLNKELNKVLRTADKIRGKGAGDISGGDVDKLLSQIQKMLQDAGGVRSRIENDKGNFNVRSGESVGSAVERYADIENSVRKFSVEFSKALAMVSTEVEELTRTSEELRRRKTPRSRVPGGPSWGEIPFPEDVDLNTRQAQRDKQRVTSRVTSSVSGLQRAADSGQLSYKQAEILEGQIRDVYMGSTGATQGDYDDVVAYAKGETKGVPGWDVAKESPMGRAQEGIKSTSSELHTLQDSLAGIQEELYGKDSKQLPEEQESQLLLAEQKTLEEIKKQHKLREEHKSLLTEIVDGINRVEKARDDYVKQTGSTDIRKAAEDGTIKNAIASRANAIMLSVGTAMAFSIKSALSEGKSIVDSQREDSLRVGFSTENYDFRGIRQEARASGAHMGFTGTDMLGFGQSVMGSMGYNAETAGVTDELARAEKFMGTQDGAMQQMFESALRTGIVDDQESAKDFTDMVAGGIIASGMVGREDEQIAMQQALLDEQASGRAMSNEEMKSQMALINTLSGTGNKALQGKNLEQNLGSLQDSIAGMDPFSYLGFHMGVGTDSRFTGDGGYFRFQQETEKGLGSQAVIDGMANMVAGKTDERALDLIMNSNELGVVTTDAAQDILELLRAGELDVKTGIELQEQIDAGGDRLDRSQDAYDESGDSTRQQLEANREARKANTSDNDFADGVAEFSRAVEAFGAQSAGKAFGVTGLIGGATGLLTGVLGGASLTGTPLLKNFGSTIQSVFGLGGIEGAAGSAASGGVGSAISGGLASAGAAGKSFLAGTATKLGAGATGATGLAALGATSIAGGIGGAAGIFSGVTDLLESGNLEGKAKQDKMFSGGTKLGMVGTGSATGAAIGSMFGGVGAIPGALIGAGIGGVGALLGGEGIGGWLSNKWSGEDATKDVAEVQQGVAQAQQDVATTSSKASTESLRAENVHQETRNLSEWDRLVEEIRQLLDVARRQNGIIGSTDGIGAFSSGGVGAGGELGAVGEGKYWTSSNLRKHDITKTSSELTSEQLDAWIADKTTSDSKLIGMGSAFMEAGNKHGVDPRMLVGLAGLESDWGRSNYAQNRNNFFGINAQTNNPDKAFSYGSAEDGIMAGAANIERMFTSKGATTLDSMVDGSLGYKYADDPSWSQKLADVMSGAENYTAPSGGEININTTVNVESTGDSKKDGDAIAKATQKSVEDSIAKYQVNIPAFFTHELIRR